MVAGGGDVAQRDLAIFLVEGYRFFAEGGGFLGHGLPLAKSHYKVSYYSPICPRANLAPARRDRPPPLPRYREKSHSVGVFFLQVLYPLNPR